MLLFKIVKLWERQLLTGKQSAILLCGMSSTKKLLIVLMGQFRTTHPK